MSVAVVVFLALAASLQAQSIYGEIRGTVTDPSGAVIGGAAVTATNTGTGEPRKTTTDAVGNYSLVNLEAGTYEVAVEHSGFRKVLTQNITLRAREVVRADARLELAAAVAEVMVMSSHQVITTDQATIVDSKSPEQLAMNFRAGGTNSIFMAIALAPGVQTDSGGGSMSLAGSMPFMATSSVDGISSTNVRSNGILSEMFPSGDSIDELRVSSISNNAEYAQVGDVTTTSRAGTNNYHGSAFWYHQNGALDARDFFSTRRVPFRVVNDFGAHAGGPVIRNKTFFFGAFEGLRFREQSQINIVVPPDNYRTGNLSSVTAPIRDPLDSNRPFDRNVIPTIRISQVSARILERLYPRQNQATGDAINVDNYRLQRPAGRRNDQFDLRGDHVFNERHNVFGRFSYKDLDRTSPVALTTLGEDRLPQEVRNLVGAYNYVIRANLVNEFRFGYANWPRVVDFGPDGKPFDGPALVRELGITNLPPDPPNVASVPDIGITGFQGTAKSRAFTQLSRTYQFTDNITWTRGRHTLKLGADLRKLRYRDNVSFFSGDDLGEYRFNGMFTGNPFADFLLGWPNRTRFADTGPDVDPLAYHQGYFAQDDFKVTSKLTLNYGVRYEYHPPFWDSTLQLTNFDRDFPGGRVVVPNQASLALVVPGFRASIGSTPIVAAKDAGLPETLRVSDKNNFMPRFGFAYRPFGNRTVIRGGYSIYTVTILGAVNYSLVGIHTSDVRTFTNRILPGGVPELQFPGPFLGGLGGTSAAGSADFRRGNQPNAPDPYVQQWNFTIERDMGWNTGLRITYTGSHTIGLFNSPDLNQVKPNTVGYSVAKATRPFPNWAIVYSRDTGASAKYNALMTEVQKRFSSGLFFQSSWVWSKNLSDSTGSNSTGFSGENGSVPTDRFNLGLDSGNVSPTRRHRWLTTFMYALPFGIKGGSLSMGEKIANHVINGWQLSGIMLFQTGPFLTPITGGATDPSGTNLDARANDRPDYTGTALGNRPEGQRTILAYFDRTAFERPASNIGRFGLVGPGRLVGPGTANFSARLQKRIFVREGMFLQLEGSFVNLFNHTNFGIPQLNLSRADFGRISSTQGAEGGGARNIQLGMRFTF